MSGRTCRSAAEHAAAAEALRGRERSLRERIAKECSRAQAREQAGADTRFSDGYISALESELLLVEQARGRAEELAGIVREDLPERVEPAPWWASLRAVPGVDGTMFSVARQHQALGKSEALLWIESGHTAEDEAGRVQLLDELLGAHGYVRVSRPRWTPGSAGWSVMCDVDRAAVQGARR